ncbi:MAG: dTDP-4-dehydrorhamnose reductase [Cytophagaceae bacterium]|jgi:dTDP-4-dehydrorhamnose reductase|nr:dTDP-4-dehydrorhamnose reductase [Cytophagaceae bacterium]
MKTILVTGSNGLLGQKLTDLLKGNAAYKLIATARGEDRYPDKNGYQYVSLDITNQQEVDEVLSTYKPDAVIHTAAMTNVDQCETDHAGCDELNVKAVQYIVAACEKNNIYLAHLSTDFIFNGDKGPLTEEEIPDPISYYGESKLKAEQIVQAMKGKWSILRTVLVFGIVSDMSRSNIVLWVKGNLEQKKTIKVVNDQFRTPTLAEDLAMGCFLAVDKQAQGIYNISGSDLLTPYDIAQQTAKFFNLDASLIEKADSSTFKQAARRPLKTGFIIDKAKRDLGYQPHTFEQGIKVLSDQLSQKL